MYRKPGYDHTSKLFVVYLGGCIPGCHIELHDVRFVIGNTIEDTRATLIHEWIGDKKTVHIDAYTEIKEVDGFTLSFSKNPSLARQRLFFVNLGGYDPEQFTELHEVGLFVAEHPNEAKKRAKRLLLTRAAQQHKDDLFDVDDCLSLKMVGGLHLHLTPIAHPKPWTPLYPDWYGYDKLEN